MSERLDKTGLLEAVGLTESNPTLLDQLLGCSCNVLRGIAAAVAKYNETELTEDQQAQLDIVVVGLAALRQEALDWENNELFIDRVFALDNKEACVGLLEERQARLAAIPGEVSGLVTEQADLADVKVTEGLSAWRKVVGKQIRVSGARGQGVHTDLAGRVAKKTINGTEYFVACESHKEWTVYSHDEEHGFTELFDHNTLPGALIGTPSAFNRVLYLYTKGYNDKVYNVRLVPGIETTKTILARPRKANPIYSSGSAGVTLLDKNVGDWVSSVQGQIAQHGTAVNEDAKRLLVSIDATARAQADKTAQEAQADTA